MLDVGAGTGTYIQYTHSLPITEYVALEPYEYLIPVLKRNVRLNPTSHKFATAVHLSRLEFPLLQASKASHLTVLIESGFQTPYRRCVSTLVLLPWTRRQKPPKLTPYDSAKATLP